MDQFVHYCSESNAAQFAEWMTERGGLAIWQCVRVGLDTQWTAPILDRDGEPQGKPHPYAAEQPKFTVTDPEKVGVVRQVEWKRLHMAVRQGSQGITWKITDGSNYRLNKALEKAGPGATYYFDYDTQEAVILVPDPDQEVVSLARWVADRQQPALPN